MARIDVTLQEITNACNQVHEVASCWCKLMSGHKQFKLSIGNYQLALLKQQTLANQQKQENKDLSHAVVEVYTNRVE